MGQKPKPNPFSQQFTLISGIVFIALFVLAMIFQESWWGIHHIAFLPSAGKYGLLVVGLGLIIYQAIGKTPDLKKSPPSTNQKIIYGQIILIVILMGVLFWNFPIADDIYGDAANYRPYLQETVSEIPEEVRQDLFSFEFKTHGGRKTVTALITYLAWATETNYYQSFRIMDLICGIIFVITWLVIVQGQVKNSVDQWVYRLLGITSPFLLTFFGHTENYAPVLMVELIWLGLLLQQLQIGKSWRIWALLVLGILLVKLHPVMILLSPAWVLTMIQYYFPDRKDAKWLLSPKGISSILALGFISFLYLYFIHFQDHIDDRNLISSIAGDHIFLPLFSPTAPLDEYNLFSFNHIFDYFQVMLFLSPLSLWLLVIRLTDKPDWSQNSLKILGTTFMIFSGFFFMINPLFSMPMEWDLYTPIAPVLLVFVLVLGGKLNQSHSIRLQVLPAIGIALLSSTIFWVNASNKMLSYRMETVGVHIFKTYHTHASNTILFSLNLVEDDPQLYLERKNAVLKKLAPFATPGNDKEYANLLFDQGLFFQKAVGDEKTAYQYFIKTEQYDPLYPDNLIKLMENAFRQGDYIQAIEKAKKLIELRFPNQLQSLSFGIHCGLMAKEYSRVKDYCIQYLVINPEDTLIQEIKSRIEANDRLEELPNLFSNGK